MCAAFCDEYERAEDEYEQLLALLNDVCWYSFETQCRTWRHPWHESLEASYIELKAQVHSTRTDHGRTVHKCTFPTYYAGMIADAPPLPPDIVLSEVERAKEYMLFMRDQRTAPHDWAPGGRKYEQLVRESPGAAAYDRMWLASNSKARR